MPSFTTSHTASAAAPDTRMDEQTTEHLDESRSDVRQRILALRQQKRAQWSASSSLNAYDASSGNPDRLTWVGLDDEPSRSASASSSRITTWAESRNSEDETDDADSTVLGHYVSALPLPPTKSLLLDQSQPRNSRRVSQPSLASEDTSSSSQESSSQASCMLDDDTDAHSLHTTTATESSSGPPSRRTSSARGSIASRRRSHIPTSKELTLGSAGPSKSIGPPPSFPLPPRPSTSPRSPCSPSARNGDSWSSRRSSRTSALTATSSRSSTSARSSWKSSNPSLASSRLIPTPSERSDTSDLSDEELIGIRNISKHFPSPTPVFTALPASVSHMLERNGSLLNNQSRSTAASSRINSQSRRSASETQRALSPVQDSPMDLQFDTPHARNARLDGIRGEDSSDSALSDVLDLTDNKGILVIAKRLQQASLQSGVGIARVSLGARALSRSSSEQSLRQNAKTRLVASSPNGERQEVMLDAHDERTQQSPKLPQGQRSHHKRSSTMSKSMSELVAALDLEATEWGQRLGESENMEFDNGIHLSSQARESQLLDAALPRSDSSYRSNEDKSKLLLVNSDSLPSLSSSGSQEISIDDTRGPDTAESSLVRSNSAKSTYSACDSTETNGAEFRSIYDAYRASNSTMTSRFTAPAVRIEDPEGGQISDSELEEGDSSSDDVPRKRNKASRKKRLGFEEQRVSLRPRPSIANRTAFLSTKPSQTFKSSLISTQEEEDTPASSSVPTTTTSESADPYAFYEFSPSLPPFMPTGLSPRDLTGRGTWSSIVARASEGMRTRQPSIASLESFATTTSGPVSMRQIRATARAKQRQVDAAHRAREEMSDQIAAMSYKPFAIHDHALSFVNHAGLSADIRSSISSIVGAASPEGMASGRSSSMSSLGYADSIAPSVGEFGSRWPVAVGADQGVGPEDAASIFTMTPFSLSRQPSTSRAAEKKYVEFSMQTSPQPSPTESKFPISDSLTVDDAAGRVDAEVGSEIRRPLTQTASTTSRSGLDYLGIDAPLRRRKSAISLLSVHNLDTELDEPGLWPSRIRAPRLSSYERRRSNRESTVEKAFGEEAGSDEESDLDVSANLEDLAERSGVLDASRGSKRKLHSPAKLEHELGSSIESTSRPIASIPARSRRISAALDRIRAQRISRNAGWGSSDDEEVDGSQKVLNTPRKNGASSRPSLPCSIPAKVANSANPLRRSKSMASMGPSKGSSASPSLLRVRSPSPDLSILTNGSDDEEVLLTADLELDSAELSHQTILDEEFDVMVGETIASRFSKAAAKAKVRKAGCDTSDAEARSGQQGTESENGSSTAANDASETSPEAGKDSQQTVQLHTRSRTSSMSSVIEIIQEADELLSSTGHSVGHSSGHDTNISDSGGTSGHDPQKPNHVLAEIIRRRMSMRLHGLQTPSVLTSPRPAQVDASASKNIPPEDAKLDGAGEEIMSPSMQDTPDTMAGSEIWTSFHVDRSSTASTATTWSYRSTEDVQPRLAAIKAVTDKESEAPADVGGGGVRERVHSSSSSGSSDKPSGAVSGPSRALPVLRRKSSGLPVARTIPKPQPRPSLPLPDKADCNAENSGKTVSAPKPAMRRYQSIATLRARPSDGHRDAPFAAVTSTPLKDVSAGQNAQKPARYSEGFQATPSKAIRSVGGGITPSKLPSLRNAASTTSLRTRARAAADQNADPSPVVKSGIPQRLPVSNGNGRSRLPSPNSVGASGLPRAAPASSF